MKRLQILLMALLLSSLAWGQNTFSAAGNINTSGSDCTAATSCSYLLFNPQTQGSASIWLTGTWSGTIQFEVTSDVVPNNPTTAQLNALTWVSVSAFPAASTTGATNTTGNGLWVFNAANLTGLRVRASAMASGVAAVTLRGSVASARGGGGGGGGSGVGIYTVATLPAGLGAGGTGTLDTVKDGTSASDCTVGGAGTAVTCIWTGAAWAFAGSAASAPAYSAIGTGANTTATMTCGTGCTMTVSGTGVNNANQVNGGTVPATAPLLGTNGSNQPISVTTIPTSTVPAFTGDMTNSAGSLATTVGKINGGSVPATAKVLGSNGSSQPIATALTSGHLLVGSAGNVPADVAASGDLTLSNAGLFTVTAINGTTVPTSAKVLGTDGSAKPIAAALTSAHLYVGSAGNVPADVALSGDSSITNAGVMTNIAINGTALSGLSTGILRNTTGTGVPSSAELSGDATTSGSNAVTVTKINGTSFPTSASVVGSDGSAKPIAATAHGIQIPLDCADSSGSGAAQVCTTSPSFTPTAGQDCIRYRTTTANTGDVTLNVNSTSAYHIRKWLGASTLAASDLPALTPQILCLDNVGPYWEAMTIGNTPSGAGGTINNSNQYGGTYFSAPGSTNTLSGFAPPTTQGYFGYSWVNTTNAASAPQPVQTGLNGRALITGTTTDTVLYSDINSVVDHDESATQSVTEALPTPTLLNNSAFAFRYSNHSTHNDTLDPHTTYGSTIQKGASAPTNTATVASGEACLIKVDPNSSANWIADCGPNTGLTGIVTTATSLYGVGYTGTATNASSNTINGISNPLFTPLLTGTADRAVAINNALAAATNSVYGDVADARGELSTNNIVSHSPYPQGSLLSGNLQGFNLWLPSGKFTTSVPWKIEQQSAIINGTGRGNTNGTGASMLQASTVGAGWSTGIGSGGSVTCTAVSGGACTGYTFVAGSGYYYNPVVVFSGGSCANQPAKVLQIVDGVIVGVKTSPQGAGTGTADGSGCATPPTATIYPGPLNAAGFGNLNMALGQGPALGPFVEGVGNPSDSYTEDTQIYNRAYDCGAVGTPGTLGAADMTTGLSIWGSQESSYFFGLKVTDCMIADFDIGGGSNQTQNLGPLVGTEVLSPSANAPTPNYTSPGSGTYSGTPWSGTGSVGPLTISSVSATAGGLVTVTLSSTVTQITQGQSITVSGVPTGTHGTVFNTLSGSTGSQSYYEVTSPTCLACNSFKYQVNGVGQTDSPATSPSAGIITPWPVGVRFNSSAITSGHWHSTTVGYPGQDSTPATSAEVTNTVTLTTVSGNFPASFYTGAPVTVENCSVRGYNITAPILSGGAGGTTLTYTDPTSGLGAGTGCTAVTAAQPVDVEVAGLGGLFMGNHAEKAQTLMDIGGVNWSQGQTILNNQNTTAGQTSYSISGNNPVTDLVVINSGAAANGAGGMPSILWSDKISGLLLTSDQQTWIPFLVRDNSGNAAGLFSMVDPATTNSNCVKNATNFYNGLLAGYSSTCGVSNYSFDATTGNGLFAGTLGVTGHVTLEGVTSTAATGTGKLVFSIAPTLTGHPTIEGVTSTGATGTGKFVFDTGSTPTSMTLTNATGLPAAGIVDGTNGQLLTSGSSNPAFIDDYAPYEIPAANQNAGTVGAAWSLPASNACTTTAKTGTNVLDATLTCTTSQSAQTKVVLSKWDTAVNPYIRFIVTSTDLTGGHTLTPTVAVSCSKGDGTATYDNAFQTPQSGTAVGPPTAASAPITTSTVQLNSTSMTNCVKGSVMYLKFSFTGASSTDLEYYGVRVTVPELNIAGAQ